MPRLLRLWFGLSQRVDRRTYAWSGFGLMALKYALDALLVWSVTGVIWTPASYLSPLVLTREMLVGKGQQALLWVLAMQSLPFLWIGASMTFRRVLDAGLAPRYGLLFFVPVVNYFFMLLLCVLPSRDQVASPAPQAARATRVRAALRAAAPAAALGVVAVCVSVLALDSYLAVLFVGSPFALGFVAGYRAEEVEIAILAALLALLLAAGALLLLALEGVVCLLMAAPLAILLAVLGALLGRGVARIHRLRPSHALTLLLALPLLMGVEKAGPGAPLREVVSVVEIDAPPAQVWPRVVGFTELPPPHELVFALGIAYPMRARIEGEGVGAIRRCEFSTGAFVEPITVWDPPRRLAFDVASQPEPMHETSPYRVVHAPHLLDGLRSERGEFRLIELPAGRTRLEGRTWYRVQMAPQAYWGLYADRLIHAIHARVLAHVRTLAEADASALRAS
jgi:hypothetical protein